ncbi:MAG: PQQ-binding-like beta-propeller repeat protein [Bryobacterales bacterium]|nr:PQQ-binding-like beta-propeller repeat protein [Bryobacterales bacterium]
MKSLKIAARSFLFCAGMAAPAADWLTDGGDPQRNNWQKDEKLLSVSTVKDIKLLWKVKLANETRAMHNLLPPLVIGSVDTAGGKKQLAIQAGVSDNIYAIDVATGKVAWHTKLESTFVEPAGRGPSVLCPGGMTANVTIGPGGAAGKYTIYAAGWDGRLHQINAADGKHITPPTKFMPPNGKPYAMNLWKNVVWTHSAQGCGGNPNVVYAYDLATNKVGSWGPAGGGMWGRSGPAISAVHDTMYTGTGDGRWDPENGVYGNGMIGVRQNKETKALELTDYYGPSNAEWLVKRDLDMQVTPTIFNYKGKEYMVDASKECRLYFMDTESIGGDDHRTPLERTPLICNEMVDFAEAGIWGSLTSFEDPKGQRWVLTPFWGPKHSKYKAPIENGLVKKGAVAAFKVVDGKNGKPTLQPAWISRDMDQAEPPVYANGVVFGYGSGENTAQAFPDVGLDFRMERRVPKSTHAVLFALDAQTGKELWNSGKQITKWNHWSGIAVANGRIYINTFDGELYCFGLEK